MRKLRFTVVISLPLVLGQGLAINPVPFICTKPPPKALGREGGLWKETVLSSFPLARSCSSSWEPPALQSDSPFRVPFRSHPNPQIQYRKGELWSLFRCLVKKQFNGELAPHHCKVISPQKQKRCLLICYHFLLSNLGTTVKWQAYNKQEKVQLFKTSRNIWLEPRRHYSLSIRIHSYTVFQRRMKFLGSCYKHSSSKSHP
jgi:hypothetical protein